MDTFDFLLYSDGKPYPGHFCPDFEPDSSLAEDSSSTVEASGRTGEKSGAGRTAFRLVKESHGHGELNITDESRRACAEALLGIRDGDEEANKQKKRNLAKKMDALGLRRDDKKKRRPVPSWWS